MKVSKPVIFTLIFAIGAVLYLYVFADKKKPHQQTPTKPSQTQAVQPAPGGAISGETLPGPVRPRAAAIPPEVKDVNWARDPFSLPRQFEDKQKDTAEDTLRLVAVIHGGKRRIAVINDTILAKGDMIQGERVDEIRDDSVTLSRNGKKRVVFLEDITSTDVEINIKKRGM